MKSVIIKIFLVIIYLYSLNLYSKPDIINPVARQDTIDFGMCLVGDSLETFFNIINPDKIRLKIGQALPSFFLGQLQGYDIQFEEFKEDFITPLFIERTDKTVYFKYYTKTDLNKYPIGKKRAFLKLSVFDPDVEFNRLSKGDSLRESDLLVSKSYILIARKTLKYIDGFEPIIRFDSVYVGGDTARQFWKVQNSFNASLSVNSQKFEMLSPVVGNDFEINYISYPMPVNFPKKFTSLDWQFTYLPKDLQGDSAQYLLYFNPIPSLPDKIDSAFVKINGMGVKQEIKLLQNNEYVYGDTIDFGNVWVTKSKEIELNINNLGNIPFGTINQAILNENSDDISNNFFLQSPLRTNNRHLLPQSNDTFKISFSPTRRGKFTARLVLESDIIKRKISGYPSSARKVIFYIKGNGIEPTINTESDTVDFGNVVQQPNCPITRDFYYTINNNGNTSLVIYFGNVEPPFFVDAFDSLLPNSKKNLKISFDANKLGSFTKYLTLVTNANPPYDMYKILLKAQSVAPKSTDIEIPKDIKSKPGHRILVPILVNKLDIINAKTYTDTLEYDKTLLEFFDYDKVATASESSQIDIFESKLGGKLFIKILSPGNFNFISKDTLIKLYFNTYLGEKIKTPISFTNTIFGDGVCEGVLKPNTSNGVFSLDSVCGLEYKAIPRNKGILSVSELHPNPTNSILNIIYSLKEDSYLDINIYNSFGQKENNIFHKFQNKGDYFSSFDLSNLEQGLFFCEISAEKDRIIIPIIINK